MRTRNVIILLGMIFCGYSGIGFADTKIGLGTGINTGFTRILGGVISIPIKTGSSFMLEPFVGVAKSNEDADSSAANYSTRNTDYYQLGMGLYGISQFVNDFELYFGGSFGIGKRDRDNFSKSTSEFDNSVFINRNSYDATEYFIMPTLGISYIVNENFLLSIEAGFGYSWGEEEVEDNSDKYTTDISGTRSSTRLLFRYMF